MPNVLLNNVFEDREKWLDVRKDYLTGSEAPIAAGLSPHCTPVRLALQKQGLVPPPEESEPMFWGNKLESIIAEVAAEREQWEQEQNTQLIQDSECEALASTPDYWIYRDAKRGPHQIKNMGFYASSSWKDGIPEPILIQITAEMACADSDFGAGTALIGGNNLVSHEFDRDEKLVKAVRNLATQFMDLVKGGELPEVLPKDNAVLSELYRISSPGVFQELHEGHIGLFQNYQFTCAELKVLSDEKDRLQAEIKKLLVTAEEAKCGRFRIKWKTHESKGIDTKRLKAENPKIAEQYSKTSFRRPLLITETDEE